MPDSGSFQRRRFLFLSLVFTLLFLAALSRLFYLQIFRGGHYRLAALRQQKVVDEVLPERGNIYLNSSGQTLSGHTELTQIPAALSKVWYNVWISPREMAGDSKESAVQKLSEFLTVDEETVRERANKPDDPYEPIKDKADKKTILELEKLGFKGVHWDAFQDRYYPLGEFASQLIGFTGLGDSGQKIKVGRYGLEGYFDDELKGESGYVSGFKKALGSLVLPLSNVVKAKKGNDVFLTVDYNIQLVLEKELKNAVEKFSARGASGIIINPKTGAITAMASWPNFDPNKYNEVKNPATFLNPNIQLVFEPGSIFKPITMAAALDINVVSPELTYYDAGEVNVDGFTIRNSTRQAWGEQTMAQVLEKSLNTGAIFVLRRMPQGVWREYVDSFGFSEKTGITLSGETRGDISNLKSGVEIDWLVSSFGQGISVTPLAMTTAIAAIANGGELLKPYVVDKVMAGSWENGQRVIDNKKTVRRQVIKKSTSETLTKMLVDVVENGSGRQARIPGYSVAGKTGTAQVSSPGGGYSEETIHTFVGYSPAFDPAFAMLIKLDNPRGVEFSEATAAPIFKKVGEYILHYLGVPPDKPLSK